uniref:Uncharacterized protein n=1 Tax=Arundo donax TaxID=35708 RepID=A0A0A8Y7N4_ARUDO
MSSVEISQPTNNLRIICIPKATKSGLTIQHRS